MHALTRKRIHGNYEKYRQIKEDKMNNKDSGPHKIVLKYLIIKIMKLYKTNIVNYKLKY